jgi:hypothetical protein
MDATVIGDHRRSELNRVSGAIRNILGKARLSGGHGGPELSIAGFLEAASEGSSAERSAEAVAVRLFEGPRRQGVFKDLIISTPPPSDPVLSAGIWQAFQEATDLRKQTGGVDDYIGLRHVLFAIFTAKRGALAEETRKVLGVASLDQRFAEEQIAKFCIDYHDSKESLDVWQRILEPLKLSHLIPSPRDLDIAEQDLRMLPELLFRLAARLREWPEMLQSLDATAFWAAVRKVQPSASTIDDLRSVNDQLRGELAPGALWMAWMLNTRATELKALLLQHPDATAPA